MPKPFDLEAAKRGEPIQKRNGLSVRFIAHVPEANPAHRLVLFDVTTKDIIRRGEDGRYPALFGVGPDHDIVMAPRKVVGYVIVHSDFDHPLGIWGTASSAKTALTDYQRYNPSARIERIEFEI